MKEGSSRIGCCGHRKHKNKSFKQQEGMLSQNLPIKTPRIYHSGNLSKHKIDSSTKPV
jgi:hypothetical protein